jgi:tRNA nucleotidyltransferase (CCA-adding enzyme)
MIDVGRSEPLRARRLLARYGESLLGDLLDHKEADLCGKGDPPPAKDLADLERLREAVQRERTSPHRIRDLAVTGNDLIAIGFRPGPALGRTLNDLLDEVLRTPELNTRDQLLARAEELRK